MHSKKSRGGKSTAKGKFPRDSIPAEIKRQVRQRCGFGCVICGCPIYHYDHIVEYSVVLKHEVENITLLCPMHHDEKTLKLRRLDTIYEANSNPFNLKYGSTAPHTFDFGHENPVVVLGSVGFTMETTADFAAIVIDGTPMVGFRFEDGHALLQLRVFDQNNKLVLKIVDSELVNTVDLWDIDFVGPTLTLRAKSREILLRVTFLPEENSVRIDRGTLRLNKVEVEIWPDCWVILNNCFMISGATLVAPVGMVIGKNPGNYRTIFILPDERLSREFDRHKALQWVAQRRKASPDYLES